MIRLPEDIPEQEKLKKLDSLIDDLDLRKCLSTREYNFMITTIYALIATIIMPLFEEEGVYCFAGCLSVDQNVGRPDCFPSIRRQPFD